MKNELTTEAWQEDISCPININLGSTFDALPTTSEQVASGFLVARSELNRGV
jgi:hypothetical protein